MGCLADNTKGSRVFLWLCLFASLRCGVNAALTPQSFRLSLKDAERRVLDSSDQLKALSATAEAASEQADTQFSALYPRLSVDANYRYLTNVPKFALPFPGAPAISFGTHNNYSVGPTLSYTLWDSGAARDAYHSFDLLAQARNEEKKNAELQTLLAVREAYVRLQLALEELRLLNNSVNLSLTQNHDIETNFRAGAASRLDRVDSQRELLAYQLQFEQKQTEVSSNFRDLLALLKSDLPANSGRMGPPGIKNIQTELNLDPLEESLRETSNWTFSPPDEHTPLLRSQSLLVKSAEEGAQSAKSTYYPTVQVSANASLQYPNGIKAEQVEQNTFSVGVSIPLFEGFRSSHLVAEKRKEAEAARFNESQLRTNLERDFGKTLEELQSLRLQQKLAAEDVQHSEDAAKLYYQSYKSGRINLFDVQSANNRALSSKVNAARINAQILSQLYALRSISEEANNHGR